jgi:hypothetical protein
MSGGEDKRTAYDDVDSNRKMARAAKKCEIERIAVSYQPG